MYSRWENKENIKFPLFSNLNESGIPVYNDNELYYNASISNTLVIGNRDSNKENNILIPTIKTIIKSNESLLIYDSHNLYDLTNKMFMDNNYNIIKLDLNNLNESNKWNPLLLPYNVYKKDKDLAYDLIDELGYYIMKDETSSDPFWINSAISYFKGLVLYVFNYETEITLSKIQEIDELIKNNPNEIRNKVDHNSDIYKNLESIINAPVETKMSIISVFNQKLKEITSRDNLINLLSNNDIDLNNLDRTVIYLKSKSNNILNNISSMFISQLNYSLINKNTKFTFILNNFNELYKINNFEYFLSDANNHQIKYLLTINGFNELKNNYGKELSEMIKYNCSNLIYLLSNDYDTLKEISLLCGRKDNSKDLISIEELRTLKLNEAIILIPRLYPIRTLL